MTKHQDQELTRLEAILEEWRATKKSSMPIPAEVWKNAIKLARQLSVGQVARRLRLDHTKLKRLTEKPGETKPAPMATFLVFQPTQFTPAPSTLSCALEVESASGGIMRARLEGLSPSDLGVVFRVFGG